ncbi:regulatory associated protein of MTOR complex 1 [Lycorma delicatula]|uniref:regulatory associated protein of MTOR complex 1 n=1 Tax=Lycorma delicatula TaxID=130591 RepID=UPI003F5105E6
MTANLKLSSSSNSSNGTSNEDDVTECGDWQLPLCFQKKRHLEPIEGANTITQGWRMKERMKTVSVALVLCLNVGVDPPDIVKTQPCARLECWIDPLSMSPQKALESIGANLQKQYERWQPRARYKQSLDPTVEEVKKLCTSLRRNAKEERVLFHYNGHGVPKPTINGEVWVFNRMYTQYIPLSVYDLQTWMGAPSIYVYDCSNAGVIVDLFRSFAEQHEREYEQQMATATNNRGPPVTPPPSFRHCIQLAACSADQVLPMNPDLPADIFTSCLTTPIKIALRWFVMQNAAKLVPKVTLELIDKIPGQLSDRRTMLGELNWIFTAITDTIAWNTLPRDLFQKLFRQDLLVASLFRNFLLAERIMRSYDCAPVSSPKLPPTYQHPMWQAWDLALDLSLAQLPAVLQSEDAFRHSPFFEEQLTAFQVWLELGSENRNPPEQLPIVLQVLLSQVHRLRALELLGRFLDLGPWAVNLALSVGIFPYVLKLLQSSARELRPLLVFIWAKILAVDTTCQADLVRDNGHKYFLSVLQDPAMPSEHRTLAGFVLASMVSGYPAGQEAALQGSLVSICLEQLTDPNPLLRQWLAICLGRLWNQYDKARWCGVRDTAHEKLYTLLSDPVPEVRAAAVYALGTFISLVNDRSEHANNIDQSVAMMLINTVSQDMSPLVRKELVIALQWMVLVFENSFLSVALQELREGAHVVIAQDVTMSPISTLKRNASRDRLKVFAPGAAVYTVTELDSAHNVNVDRLKRVSSSSSISSLGHSGSMLSSLPVLSFGSVYMKMWNGLAVLDTDPFPGVVQLSRAITDYIRDQVKESTTPKELTESKSASLSLPPSPSNRSGYLAGESPPNVLASSATDLHRLAATRSSHVLTPRSRKMPNTISEDSTDDAHNTGRALVSTQFVEWSCKYFSQPVMSHNEDMDLESPEYYEREWRYLRNAALRREAKEEQRKIPQVGRLENQLMNVKTSEGGAIPPSVVLFHPYEPLVVHAGKDYLRSADTLSVWDYTNGMKLSHWRTERNSWSKMGIRITSLDFVNPHDIALLLVGSEDGAVRLWSNYTSREPTLVTAWQALPDMTPICKPHSTGSSGGGPSAGLVMAWDQQEQKLVVAGDTRIIRTWDAHRELKVGDIPTGADSCVTSLSIDSSGGPLLAAGCGDGSVRLFDRRLPAQEARVMTYREHASWVVCVSLRGDATNTLLSGCVRGDVRFFDIRCHTSKLTCTTSQYMTSMAVHRNADVFACSSANQYISIYNTRGEALNVIKYHEWFMTPRFYGPISCMAFHPHRVLLAAGSVDSALCVYSVDPKR